MNEFVNPLVTYFFESKIRRMGTSVSRTEHKMYCKAVQATFMWFKYGEIYGYQHKWVSVLHLLLCSLQIIISAT